MVHPDHILPPEEAGDLPEFEPVYPLTQGLTQKQVREGCRRGAGARAGACRMDRPGAEGPRGWPDWHEAVAAAHAPARAADLAPEAPGAAAAGL